MYEPGTEGARYNLPDLRQSRIQESRSVVEEKPRKNHVDVQQLGVSSTLAGFLTIADFLKMVPKKSAGWTDNTVIAESATVSRQIKTLVELDTKLQKDFLSLRRRAAHMSQRAPKGGATSR